jgi:hypothetical protein
MLHHFLLPLNVATLPLNVAISKFMIKQLIFCQYERYEGDVGGIAIYQIGNDLL